MRRQEDRPRDNVPSVTFFFSFGSVGFPFADGILGVAVCLLRLVIEKYLAPERCN